MGRPLYVQIWEKPATSCIVGVCSAAWLFIQRRNVGYGDVGLSYDAMVVDGQHWRLATSAFSHINVLHLVFNMSTLWSLGVVETLGQIGLGTEFYLHYTLALIVLSSLLVLAAYHVLIHRFKLDSYRRVTAVGYSCVVFGWMTILAAKQPSSKLNLFGLLSLPISFAPFESLVLTSIIVPQASFLGHLSGIIAGYSIAWGLVQGMDSYWSLTLLAWMAVAFVFSMKRTRAFEMNFLQIESALDPALPVEGPTPQSMQYRTILPGQGDDLV